MDSALFVRHSPFELVFAHLKFGELNEEEFPTGKKVSIELLILTQ